MNLPPDYFWGDLIREYLHDPPDKPLDIKGHAARGRRYAEVAAGRDIGVNEHKGEGSWADQRASQVERLPLPNAGENYHRAIGVKSGKLKTYHPLSGVEHELECPPLQEDAIQAVLQAIIPDALPMPARYLALWRLLPEKLNALHPSYLRLPAETRIPDHTVWNHLDTTAAFYAGYSRSKSLAFLSFVVGPVQPFIAAARSLKDLWSGSMMLSELAFASLIPILEHCGPTALVFPQLRGNALMDHWMRETYPDLKKVLEAPSIEALRSPCLPNRWVALVPEDLATDMAAACRKRFADTWRSMHGAARKHWGRTFESIDPQWDQLWDAQAEDFFEVSTQVLPWNAWDDDALAEILGAKAFAEAFPQVQAIRDIAHQIPEADQPGYDQSHTGRWQARMDLMGRMLASQRMEKTVPMYQPVQSTDESVAPKCSLMGNIEQMGPPLLRASADFWQKAAKAHRGIKAGERFGAVALIKRAYPEYFAQRFGCRLSDLRLDDTATVAATAALKRQNLSIEKLRELAHQEKNSWSGQWLHGYGSDALPPATLRQYLRTFDQAEIPTYYAILVMDGDHMGQWLQGEKTPFLRSIMHTDIVAYFRRQGIEKELNVRRSVSPALHASISEALGNFSLQLAPAIVAAHQGTLVYAGGDDVLALLPLETALDCAQALYQAFRGTTQDGSPDGYVRHQGRDWLTMGSTATVSAGLTVVHYKEDLRVALETARQAEVRAKQNGRNQLTLSICRHSGEWCHTQVFWDEIERYQGLLRLFMPEGSGPALTNRWAYRLRQMAPDFQAFESDAPVEAEIRRQMQRLETGHQRRLEQGLKHLGLPEAAADGMVALFDAYAQKRRQTSAALSQASLAELKPYRLLEDFSLLCQSLAFMARGRDE